MATRPIVAQTSPTIRVWAIHKAVFLIACYIIPTRVDMDEGRTVFYFDRGTAEPYADLWDKMYGAIVTASKSGIPMTPAEIETLNKHLWSEVEGGAVA